VSLLVFAYAIVPNFWLFGMASPWVTLPLLSLPWGLRLARRIAASSDGPTLNQALADTARLTLAFSLLFSIGWLL